MIEGNVNFVSGSANKLKANNSNVIGSLNEAIGRDLKIEGTNNLLNGKD